MADVETYHIPHFGGGIRNDQITQLIEPTESWDALNEDSTIDKGASRKRFGSILSTTGGALDGPIRAIWEGKAWVKKRIVVAGGSIYDFTPPASFTKIYDGFDGDKHEFVDINVFMDDIYGGIFVFTDGVNQPLWWDGVNTFQNLPPDAPVAKVGASFKSYFILGNLQVDGNKVTDTGDIIMGDIEPDNYSAIQEVDVSYVSGKILGMVAETTNLTPNFDIHIFSTPPIGWQTNLGPAVPQHPMNTTDHVFQEVGITSMGWRDMDLDVDFKTPNRKLYIGVMNDDPSTDNNIKIRILYKPTFYNSPEDIYWCPASAGAVTDYKHIDQWNLVNEAADQFTGAGRLTLPSTKHGDIIRLLPLNRDVLMVYKSDGAIIALQATGDRLEPWKIYSIDESHRILSGQAILPYDGFHWAMSTEGFLKISASGAEFVEPYGKATKLFQSMNDRWNNSYGVVLEHQRKIVVSVPHSGNEDKDGCINYGVVAGTYDRWDGMAYNVLGACSIENPDKDIDSFTGMTIDDLAGYTIDDLRLKMALPEIYGGDYDGNVFRLGWIYKDNGGAIDAWREGGWIIPTNSSLLSPRNSVEDKYTFRWVSFLVDMSPESDITFQYRTNFDPDWMDFIVLAAEPTDIGFETRSIKRFLNKTGTAIKLRWRNNEVGESYLVRSATIGYEIVD